MASPLQSAKRTVDLTAPAVRVSRIRRDPPPPPARKVTRAEIREREARMMAIGITIFALALFAVLIGFSKTSTSGWSPSQYKFVHNESV